MEETQKWYQSKIVRLALALVVGALAVFGIQYNVISEIDLDAAGTVYPEVIRAIDLIKTGQWLTGVIAIGGALIAYFRVFKTTKVIKIGSSVIKKAA